MNSVALDLLTDTGAHRSPFGSLAAHVPDRDAGVRWRDDTACGVLVLRARDTASLATALTSATGLMLPQALHSHENDGHCVRWVAPDEYWLTVPLAQVSQVHEALEKDPGEGAAVCGAVVEVSGGFGILQLAGPSVQSVLHKSTGYDTHPDHFIVGKVVGTTFAKATVVMRRLDDSSVELIVRRSMADYLCRWLIDAAAEFGLAPAG